jgi:Flp pilus assembly protein TadD
MPTLSYVFLCLTLLTLPISSWAQAPDKIPQPDYSQEAAVIEDSTYKIKFANDGTSTQEQSARVRVQSDAGVQRVGLLTFSYESGIASFEVVCVRVHKPDGTIIDTPPDSIQDMPSEVTRQAPFYSDIREKHVAVKGLSIGDTLEYKTVTHVTKPLAPGQFWFDYNFTHDAIVLKEQLEVTVPRDRAIKWRSPDAKPTIADSGNDRVYSWNTSSLLHLNKDEKIEQAKLNWEQSRGRFPHPDVQLTSFQSWDEVGRWYRDLQADRVKPSPEIIAKATELAKGAADDEAKLRAIYNYVSLQFRYIGVAFGVGRYQPHFASEVLANQYGDCKDKHTLLAALLSASGIQAVPALISSERDIDPEIPSPAQFNHVITAIPRGDSLLWLDTTSEVAPYQFLLGPLRDKSALVIWNDKPAGLVTTSAKLPFPSAQNFQMDAKLDDTGTLTGHAEFSLRGDLEILLRAAYRSTPMPQWKDLTQRISQSLGFAGEVSDVTASSPEKTDEPFRITYKYVRKDFGDWPNHRVLAPSGFIGLLPMNSSDLSSLSVPFWLGPPIDIAMHAQMEIPKEYSAELPAAIHVKHNFAAFDATYSFKDGKLISDRHVQTFLSELPKSDFANYEKFCKTVQDDYGSYIQLTSTTEADNSSAPLSGPANIWMMNLYAQSFSELPDSSNQQASLLEDEAKTALRRGDPQGAISALRSAVEADPKFARAWVTLAQYLLITHQTNSALAAFEKAIAAKPDEAAIYKIYASALVANSRFADAIAVWQSYIKLVPDDWDALQNLAAALTQAARYREATQVLESAVMLSPRSPELQMQLARAYLRNGDNEKSDTAYRNFLDLAPKPELLNQAAYELALADKTPLIAIEIAKESVHVLEEDSTDMDLDTIGVEDEEMATRLASSWAVLGFIYQRLGKSDDAENYQLASWKLTQNGVAAAHLCQFYLDQHKAPSALQMCQFARNRLPAANDPLLYRTGTLLKENDARLEKLSPGSSNAINMKIVDHVLAMRDFKLPRVFTGTATADFYVLLEYNQQIGHFEVIDTRYIHGSEKLKSAGTALTKLNLNFVSPDGNSVRVLRRGTIVCGDTTICEFMLADATSGHSVPIPFKVVN